MCLLKEEMTIKMLFRFQSCYSESQKGIWKEEEERPLQMDQKNKKGSRDNYATVELNCGMNI